MITLIKADKIFYEKHKIEIFKSKNLHYDSSIITTWKYYIVEYNHNEDGIFASKFITHSLDNLYLFLENFQKESNENYNIIAKVYELFNNELVDEFYIYKEELNKK